MNPLLSYLSLLSRLKYHIYQIQKFTGLLLYHIENKSNYMNFIFNIQLVLVYFLIKTVRNELDRIKYMIIMNIN